MREEGGEGTRGGVSGWGRRVGKGPEEGLVDGGGTGGGWGGTRGGVSGWGRRVGEGPEEGLVDGGGGWGRDQRRG